MTRAHPPTHQFTAGVKSFLTDYRVSLVPASSLELTTSPSTQLTTSAKLRRRILTFRFRWQNGLLGHNQPLACRCRHLVAAVLIIGTAGVVLLLDHRSQRISPSGCYACGRPDHCGSRSREGARHPGSRQLRTARLRLPQRPVTLVPPSGTCAKPLFEFSRLQESARDSR